MSEESSGKLGWVTGIVTVVVMVAVGVGRASVGMGVGAGGWWLDWVREGRPVKERGEDGWGAEGEAKDVGDNIWPKTAWGFDVACYEVVGVHGEGSILEDIVQTSAREREGFWRCEQVDFIQKLVGWIRWSL
jgi:hypothetical protein